MLVFISVIGTVSRKNCQWGGKKIKIWRAKSIPVLGSASPLGARHTADAKDSRRNKGQSLLSGGPQYVGGYRYLSQCGDVLRAIVEVSEGIEGTKEGREGEERLPREAEGLVSEEQRI